MVQLVTMPSSPSYKWIHTKAHIKLPFLFWNQVGGYSILKFNKVARLCITATQKLKTNKIIKLSLATQYKSYKFNTFSLLNIQRKCRLIFF